MDPYAKVFGEHLYQRRKSAGLTQQALADRIHMHRIEVGLIERGRRQPRLQTILALSSALEVPPAELVDPVASALIPGGVPEQAWDDPPPWED